MKILIPIIMFVISIPAALADSVFDNPAFDTVLLLIFAGVIFFALREFIKRIK